MVMQGICIHIEGILQEEKMADILIKVQENCDVNTVSLRIPSELNIMQSFSMDVAIRRTGNTCKNYFIRDILPFFLYNKNSL